MGRPYKDLTGQQFGRLTALRDVGRSKGGDVLWECECSCPDRKHIVVTSSNLQRLHTQSCGCYEREQKSKAHRGKTVFDVVGDIAIGYTSKNEQFFVDANVKDLLSDQSWWYTEQGYLAGRIDGELILMHRFLTNCDDNHVVDHKNHIKGDNRLCNLRVCTISENQYNRKMQDNNTSGAIGVSWSKRQHKWRAYIAFNKKRVDLGWFSNYEDAVKARQKAENKHHKEFSFANSMKGSDIQ